jgi:two-component SAPR family response regulator
MKRNVQDFIIIDDDRINNSICRQIIKKVIPGTNILTFNYPEEGIAYINSISALQEESDIVLFLDINMPYINGWEVLEELKNCPLPAREHLKIFMLSSSMHASDKYLAENNPLVSGFVDKPLTLSKVQGAIN